MTIALYRDDAYLQQCNARVVAAEAGAVVLDQTVLYAMGGGQPGDAGSLAWLGGRAEILDTRYGDDGQIVHHVEDSVALPEPGAAVEVSLDWERRYTHMRMHTALHLLGAVLKFGVTGGNISVQKSRLDFDMEEPVDKPAVQAAIDALVAADHSIGTRWITDEELEAEPDLIRTMSVKPPQGAGRVRLLSIDGVDLQPCGGTHVRSTREVGQVVIGKVEKKGRRNRRVNLSLAD